jgi:LuxR family maltose regulon positive regulatory protein
VVVASPLLETKFHVPRRRRGAVDRPRLNERLSRGAESALTLVSAPAGFGKTTLLAEWLAVASNDERSAGWLSLDQRDNDPVLFWTYLITALKTAAPGVGDGALSLLQSPQAPIEAVLATLLNDLAALAHDVVLVLDDFHLVDAPEVRDGIAFLLEHLPPQTHLVISGRADPALPLARLRARGELVEIRAAELRFTPDEAAAYLNEVMGLALTAQHVAGLERRTEGWIAALQLAALSLRGREDVASFIANFAGDDRYIVDYLAEEVLNRQPPNVQHFLLQTSILDRLSGSLCDAVTGQEGGKALLATLERENLFLVALDDRRKWYRYHQLFADVLQAHLLDEQPANIADLHGRASGWYERNGEQSAAVRHALAAKDFERAADLVEQAIPEMSRTRQEATVHGWIDMFPDNVVRTRPMLSIGFAGAMLSVGELAGVEERLLTAEQLLVTGKRADRGASPAGESRSAGQGTVADEQQYGRLRAMIELYRAALGLARGDVNGAVRHAQGALDNAPEDDSLVRSAASGLLGLAYWTNGDLAGGHRAYAACMTGLYLAGHVADTFGCAIALADIRRTQGRLGEAMDTYQQALQRAAEQGEPVLRGTSDMYVGMSEVHLEYGDIPSATEHLARAQRLGEHNGLPQNPYRWRVAMARIRQAQGDPSGALDLLAEAEHRYVSDFFPNVRPIPAIRARVWLVSGAVDDAVGWVRERGLTADDGLSYLHEFEHITLARVLMAQRTAAHPAADIAGLLERLRQAAHGGGRTGSVIEILVQQAILHQRSGDTGAAFAALEQALTLAEPAGYVRIFVDEGAPMGRLLAAAAKQGRSTDYAKRLLIALDGSGAKSGPGPSVTQGLIEPLSTRELDVLRLLGTDLDGPDIARRLFVSLNTVRTHTKNIYTKLAVNNRREAVRRGQELDLMSEPGKGAHRD